MLGEVTTTNVWALFDEEGASYANYATQSAYWPRLYALSPLTREVEPAAALEAARRTPYRDHKLNESELAMDLHLRNKGADN